MDPKKHIFTAAEKKCFKDIVRKYSKIIENKDTDSATLRIKNEAWDKIAEEFNASPIRTNLATHKQLRRLWMNLKQRQREALIKRRQLLLAEGACEVHSDLDLSALTPPLCSVESAIDSDSMDGIKTESLSLDHNLVVTPEILHLIDAEPNGHEHSHDHIHEQSHDHSHDHSHGHGHGSIPSLPLPNAYRRNHDCFSIFEKEYVERKRRADEKHLFQLRILKEQLREAKAKADLAEVVLRNRLSMSVQEPSPLNCVLPKSDSIS